MAAANNFSCGSYPVTLGPDCSGNGVCVFSAEYQRGICQCNPGYRGNADFQTANSLVECHINKTAIVVLWSLVLVVMCILLIIVVRSSCRLHAFHKAQNARLVAAGKPPVRLSSNRSLIALIPFFVTGFPAIFVIAIMRIVAQEDHIIGKDWGVTVVWFIMRGSFYVSGMRFQPALIESLLKGQRAVDALLWRNKAVANLVMFFAVASMAAVLAPLLAVPADPFDFYWGRFAYVYGAASLAITMIISYFQARFATKKINEVLVASYESTKDQKTLTIANKLKGLQASFMRQQVIQAFLQAFVACFPFMWTMHDYLVILTSTSTAYLCVRALTTITNIQQRSAGQQRTRASSKDTFPGPASSKNMEIVTNPHHDSTSGDL